MRFEFATAARIVFGPGSISQLAGIARELGGSRLLVVTGKSAARHGSILDQLRGGGFQTTCYGIAGEPTVEAVRTGAEAAHGCDMVIAIGGGSVIDGGKAIAAMATNPGGPLDYLEVIGKGQPLQASPLPFIAVPTTAGTGSEVTRNAVLGSPQHGVKASLRSAMMLAKVALVDPELTHDLPQRITASSGLDALTQLIEPYVSPRATPITDDLCVEGIRRGAANLPRAYADGHDAEAREKMSLVALYGGLALANAGLGVVHGFAAPIGGMFDAPHGAVCAAVLPHGMEANIRALRARAPEHPALERYREIARIFTGETDDVIPENGVDRVRQLCQRLEVPPLRTYGISTRDIPDLVDKAAGASSMKANPIVLTKEELTRVIEAAL